MDANLKCLCGKVLIDNNVCPIPNGVKCDGQLFTRQMARDRLMPFIIEGSMNDNSFVADIYIFGYNQYDIR